MMRVTHVVRALVVLVVMSTTACVGHKDPVGPIGDPPDEPPHGEDFRGA